MADCEADRHGDHNAYRRGCRCPEAREDRRLYYKRWHEGRNKPGMLPAAGTIRRLQALSAIGWGPAQIAERLGMTTINVQQIRRGRNDTVTRQQHERIEAVYNELQGTAGPSLATRASAERAGWAPPLAWNDSAIDDPAAQPRGVGAAPTTGRVDLGEVEHLASFGVSRQEIAQRMNVRLESIERAEMRAQARARQALAQPLVPVWTAAHEMGDAHAVAR